MAGRVAAQNAITVTLEELRDGRVPSEVLESAFGPSSLGIIVVSGLPEKFETLRHRLLSYSSCLANLPTSELLKLESAEAKYLVGWSLGKETLKNGKPDTYKGSYYVNPMEDPALQRKAVELYPSFPEYTAQNIWPSQDVLPGFRDTFVELCSLIIDTAALVARACDRYAVANIEGYQSGYLERVVKSSVSTKARLLHYFPPPAAMKEAIGEAPNADADDWCATHLDHGCLTGLTSAMFVDEAQNPPDWHANGLPELDASPDPNAGLYIQSRDGKTTKVNIPRDCLAFQTGEALEVITQGKFRAVPHWVASHGTGGGIARNTLAVFTQPNLWEKIDNDRDFATFARQIVDKNTVAG